MQRAPKPKPLPTEQNRVPLSLRVSPEIHAEIVARTKESGRSLTFESEVLLEQGLLAERIGGGRAWVIGHEVARLFDYRVGSMQLWRDAGEPDPLDHPTSYGLAMARAITFLASGFPGKPSGRDIDAWLEVARSMIEEGLKERNQ
jgi:hypothetical protein